MGRLRLYWKGDVVSRHMLEAARGAIDETAEAAASKARSNLASHGGPYYTGELEGDIQVIDRAQSGKVRTWVHWGAPNNDHALWAEIGVNGAPGKHFFRQASDEEYPELAMRIRRRLD